MTPENLNIFLNHHILFVLSVVDLFAVVDVDDLVDVVVVEAEGGFK
jgi:hypothetical protein